MAQNPWDAFPVAPSAGPLPAPPPDPMKVEDQAIQRETAARAARGEQRDIQRDQRSAQKDSEGTSDERTAGFLTGRIKDAVGRLSVAGIKDRSALSPTLGVEAVRSVAGNAAANYTTDADRQIVRAAQLDILDAALTLGTGAAYNKEQLESYRESYFPQLGDGPDTIKSKNEALRALLVNAKVKAGRAAPDIDAALSSLESLNKPVEPTPKATEGGEPAWTEEKSKALWGQSVFDANHNPLGPDGGPGFDKDGNSLGLFGSVTDNTPDAETQRLSTIDGDQTGMAGLGTLAKQGITLGLSDEAAGIGGAIASGLQGKSMEEGYNRNRDAARLTIDRARDAHPYTGTVAEMLGGGGALRAGTAALSLPEAFMGGAKVGGVTGFGYGKGVDDSVMGAGVGALLGGGLGLTGQYGANRLAARAASRPQPDMEVIAAGERQNIPIRQPDARPELRGKMSQTETTQHGGPLIAEGRASDAARIEQRVEEVGGTGNPSDPYALGGKIQDAGERYIDRTRIQKNANYDRAERLAGGQRIAPTQATAAVDRNIAELEAQGGNTNAGVLQYLRDLKQDLAKDGGFSISEFQGLRSAASKRIKGDQALTVSDADRRLGDVVKSFTADAQGQLPKPAVNALKQADAFYAERQDFIGSVLKQVMGNKGAPLPAETAAQRVVSMAQGKGNYERFSRLWGQLDPAEQADTAATIAASLGRKANGEFSPATLIRSLDPKQGINPRTARLIFGDEGAQALVDLRTIANAKTATASALNNSRTGVAVNGVGGSLKTLMMGALGFGAGGPGGAALGAMSREFFSKLGEQRAARMLLNPNFTKWVRNAPNTTSPRIINNYLGKLSSLSSVAANDNQAFMAALRSQFAKSPGAAAAEDAPDSRRVPPQQ